MNVKYVSSVMCVFLSLGNVVYVAASAFWSYFAFVMLLKQCLHPFCFCISFRFVPFLVIFLLSTSAVRLVQYETFTSVVNDGIHLE
jgi:hypothetical protein